MAINVQHFFDPTTYTLSYIVFDNESKDAIVIDPVWNYEQAASKTSKESIHELLKFIESNKLNIHYILETHAHADHITGAIELKKEIESAKIGISENIKLVQQTFKTVYNLENFAVDGSQFDLLLTDSQEISCKSFTVKVITTPGHTPACCSFLIDKYLFTGDALFMPDYGTGRCDFPLGSAKDLYHSVHEKIYTLSDDIEFFTGHDYQPNGRELRFKSTIGESKGCNIQLKAETSESEFVKFRTDRDALLNAPKLLYPSLQVNITGGRLPLEDVSGKRFLKIPIK